MVTQTAETINAALFKELEASGPHLIPAERRSVFRHDKFFISGYESKVHIYSSIIFIHFVDPVS